MTSNLSLQIADYFTNHLDTFLMAVKEHIGISAIALVIAITIGVPAGYVCVKYEKIEQKIVSVFQVLRIIPSLAILLLLLPIMGTGAESAIVALVVLAIPPILMNTVAGMKEVPEFLLETAYGIGMTEKQALYRVTIPLAMPFILTGAKIAAIEIIASATLAAKIGAGGLGEIIFTGLGLNKTELLLIGGISVALLSILAGLLLDLIDRCLLKFKYVK